MSIQRKNEHIEYAMKSGSGFTNVFKDVHIIYDSIPELNYHSLDTGCQLIGSKFSFPIMINAMTGGSEEAVEINKALALAAAEFNIPVAAGSQTIAVKDKSTRDSFKILRKSNKGGFILANVSANASFDAARQAVEMIEADALQLHVNVLQELIMPEGDRNFKGWVENIKYIADNIGIPVMVKEVGFGMSKDTIFKLKDTGIKAVDIGGHGGTNFASIESLRRGDHICRELSAIGIPTPVSLLNILSGKPIIDIVCGGGIRSGLDMAKALIMGANFVSVAYPLLKAFKEWGEKGIIKEMERFIYELKASMIAAGAGSINELHKKRVIITGRTHEWIEQMTEF